MISYTAELLEKIHSKQAIAAQISQLQVVCYGAPPNWEELESVVADVELKNSLWTDQQQWLLQTNQWLAAPFFQLDVQEMEDKVMHIDSGSIPCALFGKVFVSGLLIRVCKFMHITCSSSVGVAAGNMISQPQFVYACLQHTPHTAVATDWQQ